MSKAVVKYVLGFLGCVIAFGLGVWLAYYFTSGRETDLPNNALYVKYKEKTYTENASVGTIEPGAHEFSVGSGTSNVSKYSVSIAPNTNNNFFFNAGGRMYKWTDVDCGRFFTLEQTANGFTVMFAGDLSEFLRKYYGADLKYNVFMQSNTDYFTLTVKANDVTIALTFGIAVGDANYTDTVVPELELTPDNIVF